MSTEALPKHMWDIRNNLEVLIVRRGHYPDTVIVSNPILGEYECYQRDLEELETKHTQFGGGS